MRHFSVWFVEFGKLVVRKLFGGQRLHPITAQCPICRQMVRLHVNQAGRQHVYGHARELYEGSRLSVHYTAEAKCVGSGARKPFDPRPTEHQHFKLPNSLSEE